MMLESTTEVRRSPQLGEPPCSPSLLDVFCGVGGWSKSFAARGWNCVGVDIAALGYPWQFEQRDALSLPRDWIDGFNAVVMSPPCEEYARAWLPWLRGDKQPAKWALDLLEWSVRLCDRPRRIVECSNFAARHVPGSVRCESYSLWGDVPLLMPVLPRGKMAKSGMRPELRAEIPAALADTVERHFSKANDKRSEGRSAGSISSQALPATGCLTKQLLSYSNLPCGRSGNHPPSNF